MREAKTRSLTTSSPRWLRPPGCCAADTATGSWCCTQEGLLRWKSRPAARCCRRPDSRQPVRDSRARLLRSATLPMCGGIVDDPITLGFTSLGVEAPGGRQVQRNRPG